MSVDILIPNHNNGYFVELCIESILARTCLDGVRIIVHDESTWPQDRAYLGRMADEGKIILVRGNTREVFEKQRAYWSPDGHPAPYWHGCAINVLLHKHCAADYAMLMDSDVYVTDEAWLPTMLGFMADDVLVAAHEWEPSKRSNNCCVPGWWRPHYLMLNMSAYRDGMKVDWRGGSFSVEREPFRSMFKSFPQRLWPDGPDWKVVFDPGSTLWVKMLLDNPSGYRGVALPDGIENVHYKHFKQMSLRIPSENEVDEVRRELAKLRGDG